MKKKAIEKIPYQTAEKASKKYTHVAVVFTREICGISHLFVEIYENKKRLSFGTVYQDGFHKA